METTVRECLECQRGASEPQAQKSHLVSQREGYPFQKVSLDLVGPLQESHNGNCYLLTAKDTFTKWVEAFPIADIEATTIAQKLQDDVFARYGMPTRIHSDQGSQFTSELMKELCKELKISQTVTPAYNPKSNPVERSHRDLKAVLTAMAHAPGDWEDHLGAALLALRTARHSATGFTPHFMMFGREATLPIDLMFGDPPGPHLGPQEHVNRTRRITQAAYKAAREQLKMQNERASIMYDKADRNPISEGELVWLFTPSLPRAQGKFTPLWTGPYEVVRKHSPVLYTLHSQWRQPHMITVTVGVDRIKRYHGPAPRPYDTQTTVEVRDVQLADEFVEDIGTAVTTAWNTTPAMEASEPMQEPRKRGRPRKVPSEGPSMATRPQAAPKIHVDLTQNIQQPPETVLVEPRRVPTNQGQGPTFPDQGRANVLPSGPNTAPSGATHNQASAPLTRSRAKLSEAMHAAQASQSKAAQTTPTLQASFAEAAAKRKVPESVGGSKLARRQAPPAERYLPGRAPPPKRAPERRKWQTPPCVGTGPSIDTSRYEELSLPSSTAPLSPTERALIDRTVHHKPSLPSAPGSPALPSAREPAKKQASLPNQWKPPSQPARARTSTQPAATATRQEGRKEMVVGSQPAQTAAHSSQPAQTSLAVEQEKEKTEASTRSTSQHTANSGQITSTKASRAATSKYNLRISPRKSVRFSVSEAVRKISVHPQAAKRHFEENPDSPPAVPPKLIAVPTQRQKVDPHDGPEDPDVLDPPMDYPDSE